MMAKVSIEVRSGAARFDVSLHAESIERAVSFMKERYPKGNVRVKFPIEAESFFVEDRTAQRGIVGLEHPARVAA
jgi:hypothetical protein